MQYNSDQSPLVVHSWWFNMYKAIHSESIGPHKIARITNLHTNTHRDYIRYDESLYIQQI